MKRCVDCGDPVFSGDELCGKCRESVDSIDKEQNELISRLKVERQILIDALNSMRDGNWTRTLDRNNLGVWTTDRINPRRIAEDALREVGELE